MQISAMANMNWRTKKRIRETVSSIIAYTLTSALALIFAMPFIWMVSLSLQNPVQQAAYPPEFFGRPLTWSNYPTAMTYPQRPFATYFKNSLIYTFVATVGVTLTSSLVAYSFARLSFKGRDVLFVLILSTMMLPSQVTLIPQYIVFHRLRWIDSLRPLIIPPWFGSAFYIFLLRQFFLTIPRELDEAAILDGCDYFAIWWRIMLPLAKPAIVTVIAFSIVGTWNDFMGPLIYLNSNRNLTASVGLALFRQMAGDGGFTDRGILMAASVTTLMPMIILFLIAQRYFVTGIAMTGLKEG